jgi:hypothetical protein
MCEKVESLRIHAMIESMRALFNVCILASNRRRKIRRISSKVASSSRVLLCHGKEMMEGDWSVPDPQPVNEDFND